MAIGGDIVIQLSVDDKDMSVKIKGAGTILRNFEKTLNQTATSSKRLESNMDSLGTKFRHMVVTMGNLRFVAMDINDVFLRLPSAIMKNAGELERMQVMMKGLSKETTDAAKSAEGLRDFGYVANLSKTAPFEVGAISDAFVKLKTAGIEPSKMAMQAMVDSVARFGGTGDTLKRATVAIQQMAGKGVVSMEELRQQLGEAVPTAMQAMADGMGKSMAELTKIVSSGTLAAGPAIEKMFLMMRIENLGASSDMMNTWTGTLSKLNTEWMLASKAIADSGFADAAKKGVMGLVEFMQSKDFKNMAQDIGNSLAYATTKLSAMLQILIKYRSEILLGVEAWVAGKLVLGTIPAIARTIESSMGSMRSSMATSLSGLTSEATRAREAMVSQAQLSTYRAQEIAANAAKQLAADQAELASARSKHAALIAEETAFAAKMAATSGGVKVPGMGGRFQSRDTGFQYLANTSANAMMAKSKVQELEQTVNASRKALDSANSASSAAASAFGNLATQGTIATGAQRALAVATGVLRGAMNMLGGPIGVVITGLSVLTWWYSRSAAAAEEAAARIKAAKLGTANEDTVKGLQADLARAKTDAASKQALVDAANFKSFSTAEQNKRIKDAQAAKALVTELESSIGKAKVSARENAVAEEVQQASKLNQKILDGLDEKTRLELAKIRKAGADRQAGLQVSSKEYQKIQNEMVKQEQEAYLAGIDRKIDMEKKILARADAETLQNSKTGADNTKVSAVSKMATDAIAQLQAERKAVTDAIGRKVEIISKDDGHIVHNKIQDAIGNAKEKLAQLRSEVEGADTSLSLQGKLDGIRARIQQSFKDGDFKYKDGKTIKNATQDEVNELVNYLQQVEKLDHSAKQQAKLISYINANRTATQEAYEFLSDPLGKTRAGKKEQEFNKMIAGMTPEELQEHLDKLKTSKEQLRADAIAQDDADAFKNVASETKRINESLVEDTREAANARIKAENNVHKTYLNNLVERQRAAAMNLTGDDQVKALERVQQLQNLATANADARAQDLASRMRTPIQKIAAEWGNVSKNMQEATASWANKTLDAFVTLATTGKLEWRSLVTSILADMVKIRMQKAMSGWLDKGANLLTSIAGFANGGIMTSQGSMPLRKYAAGGIANSPQLAMFGEGSMNEAYVPLPDGRTIPVTMSGGGGGSGVVINITVNQAGGTTSNASGDGAGAFKQLGERVKQVVQEELVSQSRPGGLLYR